MRTAFVSILTALLFVGCGRGTREYELDSKSFDSKTLQMIQSDTGIDLPATARGLHFYYKPPIDPAYAAKIEIAPSSKEEMISELSAIKNDDNIHISESLGAKLSWWIPEGAKIVVDRQRFVGSGNYLHVTLTEDEDALMLYIEWWVI